MSILAIFLRIQISFAAVGILGGLMMASLSKAAKNEIGAVQSYDIHGDRIQSIHEIQETRNNNEMTISKISDSNKVYLSGYQLREDRMVGAGLSVGGLTGLFGAHLDLNLDDENAAWVGVGQGSGYTAVSLAWKMSFDGTYLTPYVKAGYTSWFNSSGSANGANDSIILKEFLTKSEMNNGHYSLNFLNASIGAQYNQLNGDYMGFTLFAEAIMMLNPENMRLVPNGTIGTTYYF